MPGFDDTENEIKYRVKEPGLFVDESFRTKSIAPNINVILGKLKTDPNGSMVMQALRFKKPAFDVDKAKVWVSEHKDEFEIEPDKLYSIKDVEIFSEGLWNNHNIQKKDLENIVLAYEKTKDFIRPHLKLGHNMDQKILEADGLPAAGWVKNLRIVGTKLVCDFADVPKQIFKLIKNRAYRKVSCEIYNNIDYDGIKYPKFLGAVALLGSQMPGVMNLSDILSLYNKSENILPTGFASEADIDIISIDKDKFSTEHKMPELDPKEFEQLKADKTRLEKLIEDQKKDKEKFQKNLEELNKDKKELETKMAESLQKEKDAKIDAFVSGLKAEKLMAPSMEAHVKALLGDEKETYEISENKFSKQELLKEILKLHGETSKVNFDENTHNKDAGKNELTVEEIEKYAAEHDLEYTQAYRQLLKNKDVK